MIIKGSQRGGAVQLARHLQRLDENDHVEIHELRGLASESLTHALREITAVAKGTRCTQCLFSVSFNPPETESVSIEDFEEAIARVEEKLGLTGQPRAIVFHEKEGRRHAHAVWSRIDGGEMKAINLPYFKLKLRDISRQIFLEHGWRLPEGLMNAEARNPLNFSREEWQQARRTGQDPRQIKSLFQECWAVSDSRAAFAQALEERGYFLAKGDRRGFVAVDYRGEVYAVSKWTGQRAKDVKARLGAPQDLRSVDETKVLIGQRMSKTVKRYIGEVEDALDAQKAAIIHQKTRIRDGQRAARDHLRSRQDERWTAESRERAARFRKGFRGIWDRLTGAHRKIRLQNEREIEQAMRRDRVEREELTLSQLSERRDLQERLRDTHRSRGEELARLREDIAHYLRLSGKEAERGPATEKERGAVRTPGRRPTHSRGRGRDREIDL